MKERCQAHSYRAIVGYGGPHWCVCLPACVHVRVYVCARVCACGWVVVEEGIVIGSCYVAQVELNCTPSSSAS